MAGRETPLETLSLQPPTSDPNPEVVLKGESVGEIIVEIDKKSETLKIWIFTRNPIRCYAVFLKYDRDDLMNNEYGINAHEGWIGSSLAEIIRNAIDPLTNFNPEVLWG